MRPVSTITALAVPMPTPNIDTDQIVPKQFLKTIQRTGLGRGLFYDARFDEDGNAKPGFILDTPPYDKARILVGGDNFGCGSSREHAPWALIDFGFEAVISSSFADIFYNNSVNNGLLPAIVTPEVLVTLLEDATDPANILTIDLTAQTISTRTGGPYPFTIAPAVRHKLLQGLDAIAETMADAPRIADTEAMLETLMPWLPHRAA